MRTRPGFARLLPLLALTGLAAGTIALLLSARPVQAPPHVAVWEAADCEVPLPRSGILDAKGKRWNLADLKPGTTLNGADLRGARWAGVDLRGVRMTDVDLAGAKLSGSRWRGAKLELISLDGADLRNADMRETKLVNIVASFADLRGADSSDMEFIDDSTIEIPRLRGAIWDRFTLWPAGFDPQTHGATLVRWKP